MGRCSPHLSPHNCNKGDRQSVQRQFDHYEGVHIQPCTIAKRDAATAWFLVYWWYSYKPVTASELNEHVNIHNTLIRSLENPHEVLESQRDSPKLNVFCLISRRKVSGSFVFGETTVTGSAYLDALQLWLFPHLKESEPELHLAARWCTTSLGSLSTQLVEHHCTRPMDFPQRASR
ncbi:uncharacterized protein TNCV_1841511 [Trichonephila clavipes]|nr:uncharacterized protein TNCV_1841511 [Trichonephila clavipes]